MHLERIFDMSVVGFLTGTVWGFTWKAFAFVVVWALVGAVLAGVDNKVREDR